MKLTKTREMIANEFLSCLEQEQLPWKKGWKTLDNFNPITKTKYRGVNLVALMIAAEIKGYNDPRWLTFDQIKKDENLHLQKGSKGVPIEFWSHYDKKYKKILSRKEAMELYKDENRKDDLSFVCKTYYVFNGSCIDGLEPYFSKENQISNSLANSVIQDFLSNCQISLEHKGSGAYYSLNRDTVVMPSIELFDNEERYLSVLLHECSHATGHKKRLNRPIINSFGTPEYAKEELRAEISSSFLYNKLNLDYSDAMLSNNKAYIQSWISIIKDKPQELFKAITEADKIYDYVLEKGNYEKHLEQGINMEQDKTIDFLQNMKIEDKLNLIAEISKSTNEDIFNKLTVSHLGCLFNDKYYTDVKYAIESDEFNHYLADFMSTKQIGIEMFSTKPSMELAL